MPNVGQRSTGIENAFVEGKVQRRVLDVKLCVAASYFAGLNAKHFSIELGTPFNVPDVDGEMRLQGGHLG